MDSTNPSPLAGFPRDTYWLTRFVLLRWMGFVYLIAFYVAARQLVPLVGEHVMSPWALYQVPVSAWTGFSLEPSLFWFNCSDTLLRVVPWIGALLSVAML